MNDLLRALAESDREREAPAAVEIRLMAAFRRRYRHRMWPYFAVAAAIVLAVIELAIGVWPKAQTMEVAVVTPPVPVLPVVRPVSRKIVHRTQSKEVMTAFYPLMEDALPFERGQILRVSVPASAMRSVGLPVSEEHMDDMIQADVLVGEEGLARAIRFIGYER